MTLYLFFRNFEAQVAWLAIRLAIFLATLAVACNGARAELAAAAGDAKRLQQTWGELLPETALGFGLVVLAPSMISGLALATSHVNPQLNSLGNVPVLGAAFTAVEYGLVTWGVPIGMMVCDVMLLGLGLYAILASTTGNYKVQGRVWSGTLRIGIATVVILVIPWVFPTMLLFFLGFVKALGVPLA